MQDPNRTDVRPAHFRKPDGLPRASDHPPEAPENNGKLVAMPTPQSATTSPATSNASTVTNEDDDNGSMPVTPEMAGYYNNGLLDRAAATTEAGGIRRSTSPDSGSVVLLRARAEPGASPDLDHIADGSSSSPSSSMAFFNPLR